MKDLVTFIVPALNAENTIERCLQAIICQDSDKEIIVVDNNSTDRTIEKVRKFQVHLIIERKKGAAAARNAGLRVARGTFIAFVDSDVVLPKDWINKALGEIKTDPYIAGVGGPPLSIKKTTISEILDSSLYGRPSYIEKQFVSALGTANTLYRASFLKGLEFDEIHHAMGGEDTEFGFRLRKRGYKLLYTRMLYVYHHNPETLRQLLRRWMNYGKYYPISYFQHKEMRTLGFYGRILFLPCLLGFLLLTLIHPIFIFGFIGLLSLLFFSYTYIGLKTSKPNIMFLFPFIHTLKQLALVTGIWIGFIGRCLNIP